MFRKFLEINSYLRAKCTIASAAIACRILRSHIMHHTVLANTVAGEMMFEKFCVGYTAFQEAIKNSSLL